jgi:carbon monoxide dehydrogenase subunit G
VPTVTYSTTVPIARSRLWDFVRDIDNWAPLMTGYVSHEILDDRRSNWVLRGDMGVLSREVKLGVTITNWQGPDRVDFELQGIDEAVSGGGSFLLGSDEEAASAPQEALPVPEEKSWFQRLLARFFRVVFRRAHGQTAAPQITDSAPASTELTFIWRMEASGPMAPLINAMLEPALAPAAEELAHRIAAHLTSEEAA